MVTNVSPSITASPLFTLILVMVPEVSASILFCIFMASRMTTVSPAFTLSPTFTLISLIVPGRGATTGLPAAAVGAELVLAAEAEELLDSSLFTLRSSLPSALLSSLNFTFCLPAFTGCFISTSNGIPFTVTLAILPSMSWISTS